MCCFVHCACQPCETVVIGLQSVSSVVDPFGCGIHSLLTSLPSLVGQQRLLSDSASPPAVQSVIQLAPQVHRASGLTVVALQCPVPLSVLVCLCTLSPCVCIKLQQSLAHALPAETQQWLQQLQQQRRMHVVHGTVAPADGPPVSCTWLCLFCDAAAYEAMVFRQHRTPTAMSFVALP